jgi:hypothetical protein
MDINVATRTFTALWPSLGGTFIAIIIPYRINLTMEDYKTLRDYLLKLTDSVGLTVGNTVRDLKERLSSKDWSAVDERVTVSNYNEETTILELLAAIQSADAPPEDD